MFWDTLFGRGLFGKSDDVNNRPIVSNQLIVQKDATDTRSALSDLELTAGTVLREEETADAFESQGMSVAHLIDQGIKQLFEIRKELPRKLRDKTLTEAQKGELVEHARNTALAIANKISALIRKEESLSDQNENLLKETTSLIPLIRKDDVGLEEHMAQLQDELKTEESQLHDLLAAHPAIKTASVEEKVNTLIAAVSALSPRVQVDLHRLIDFHEAWAKNSEQIEQSMLSLAILQEKILTEITASPTAPITDELASDEAIYEHLYASLEKLVLTHNRLVGDIKTISDITRSVFTALSQNCKAMMSDLDVSQVKD